jgi:hypothetical protein
MISTEEGSVRPSKPVLEKADLPISLNIDTLSKQAIPVRECLHFIHFHEKSLCSKEKRFQGKSIGMRSLQYIPTLIQLQGHGNIENTLG